jgi:hypothetical protein
MKIRHSQIFKYLFVFFLSLLSVSAWSQKTRDVQVLDVLKNGDLPSDTTAEAGSITKDFDKFTFTITNAYYIMKPSKRLRIMKGGTLVVKSQDGYALDAITLDDNDSVYTVGKPTKSLTIISSTDEMTNGYVEFSSDASMYITWEKYDVEKEDPILTLSDSVITIDDLNNVPNSLLVPPEYTIKDAQGNNILDDFDRTFYVEGTTLSDDGSYTTDAVSGTKVARTTGRLTIGDKANATGFKVVLHVTPIVGTDAEDDYNDTWVTYRVKILPITGTVTLPATEGSIYVGQVMEAPTAKITDKDGNDITDKYQMLTPVVENDWDADGNRLYVTWDSSLKYLYAKKATETNSPVKVTLYYQGKSGYEDTYPKIQTQATLYVLPVPSDKITPTISVKNPYTLYVGTWNNKITVKIFDANKNDITNSFDVSFTKVSSDDLVNYSWGVFNVPNTNTGQSIFKITATPAASRSWFSDFGITQDNLYDIYNTATLDSFIVKVIKYPTKLTISPSVRNIPAGSYITSSYYPNMTFMNVKNKSQITSYRCYVDYQQTSDAIVEEKTINYWSRGFTDVTDDDGTKWRRTWFDSSESINNWGLKIKDGITEGSITFHITAFMNNDNYYDSSSASYTLRVGKITPLVSASDTAVVATLDQANSLPQIYVTDRSGNDISSYFDLTYTITSNGSGTTITLDGQLTLSGTGKETITVTATPKADYADNYGTGSTTYNLYIVKGGSWAYRITETGGMELSAAGSMVGGSAVNGITGLAMQFGAVNDAGWSVKREKGSVTNYYATGPIVTMRDDEPLIPEDGTFLELNPMTNGFLTVKAMYPKNGVITLVDKNSNGEYETETFIGDSTVSSHRFRFPLMVGNTYYLYNAGSNIDNTPLRIYGVDFEPAWIVMRNDSKNYDECQAYLEGLNEGLPYVLKSHFDRVTFTSSDENYVTVSDAGKITPKKVTTADNPVYVTATTTSEVQVTKSDGTTIYPSKKAKMKVMVTNIPSYMVPNGYKPNVGDTARTTPASDIYMIWGGWGLGSTSYQYNATKRQTDEWKVAKMDSVGRDNMTIDGFLYASFGGQNARDENPLVDNGRYDPNSPNTWDIPCRGAYAQFEPTTNGLLRVYVLINGCVAYTGDPKDIDEKSKVKWTPFYVVDEAGNAVTLHGSTGDPSGAYTKGIFRAGKGEINYNTTEIDPYPDRMRYLNSVWGHRDSTQTFVNTTVGEHMLISKAYARFSFEVEAGKTYYIFGNNSKIGICGYTFEPQSTQSTTVALDNTGSSFPEDAVSGAKTTYTIPNARYTKGNWSSICLPFSLNQQQVKTAFGKNAKLIAFDELANDTLKFTKHFYQYLVAGRPYLIYADTTYNSTTTLTIPNVAINKGDSLLTKYAVTSGNYTFKGIYFKTTMPPYSIYMAGASNKLKYVTNSTSTLSGYHSFFHFDKSTVDEADKAKLNKGLVFGYSTVAPYINDNFDGSFKAQGKSTATGIGDIPTVINNNGMNNTIYNINGQAQGRGEKAFSTLPQGVYIVNGKKVIKR